jgi:hypothetical protein
MSEKPFAHLVLFAIVQLFLYFFQREMHHVMVVQLLAVRFGAWGPSTL